MAKTAAEWVTLYENAIESILTNGQAIGTSGQTWTKADLDVLTRQLEYWEGRAAASGTSGHPLRNGYVGAPYRGTTG